MHGISPPTLNPVEPVLPAMCLLHTLWVTGLAIVDSRVLAMAVRPVRLVRCRERLYRYWTNNRATICLSTCLLTA